MSSSNCLLCGTRNPLFYSLFQRLIFSGCIIKGVAQGKVPVEGGCDREQRGVIPPPPPCAAPQGTTRLLLKGLSSLILRNETALTGNNQVAPMNSNMRGHLCPLMFPGAPCSASCMESAQYTFTEMS